MLIAIAIVVVLIAVVLGLAASKPDVLRIQRVATVKAPRETIFALLNDFHKWNAWSPWEKMDPNLARTFSGSASGKGAVYEWEGNPKVGKGRMEITNSAPPSKVVIKLDFIKPFEGHNVTTFTLDTDGGSTKVTWAMEGPSAFMAKLMQVFMNMDKMIGKDFEAGLANMKAVTEK